MVWIKNERTKHIPVILLSAHTMAEDALRVSGAEGFLAKPFQLDVLYRMVQKYLKISSREQPAKTQRPFQERKVPLSLELLIAERQHLHEALLNLHDERRRLLVQQRLVLEKCQDRQERLLTRRDQLSSTLDQLTSYLLSHP